MEKTNNSVVKAFSDNMFPVWFSFLHWKDVIIQLGQICLLRVRGMGYLGNKRASNIEIVPEI